MRWHVRCVLCGGLRSPRGSSGAQSRAPGGGGGHVGPICKRFLPQYATRCFVKYSLLDTSLPPYCEFLVLLVGGEYPNDGKDGSSVLRK
jgi:hypothetical protein